MSWYKTGTITVNNGSAAITGSGTAWIANAANGEAIYLPDGKFYEIASVNSDTSLTLAGNYTGTSLAGQSYTILPSQSFIRDLAAQAASLINSYASIANAAGAGKFGDGTLGAPGISFVNDTNTGIRRTADGTFALVANGVDVVTIGPSGMVLVTPNIGVATGTSLNLGAGALSAGPASVTALGVSGAATLTSSGGDQLDFSPGAGTSKRVNMIMRATDAGGTIRNWYLGSNWNQTNGDFELGNGVSRYLTVSCTTGDVTLGAGDNAERMLSIVSNGGYKQTLRFLSNGSSDIKLQYLSQVLSVIQDGVTRFSIASGATTVSDLKATNTTELKAAASGAYSALFKDSAGTANVMVFHSAGGMSQGWNGQACALYVGKDTANGRGANVGGTVNTGGSDYAEYMRKASVCGAIPKGAIVGIDADGLITDCWQRAISFAVKSTDPSYVGGDVWGNEDRVGRRPDEPQLAAPEYAGRDRPEGEAPVEPVLSLPPEPVQQTGEIDDTFYARRLLWQRLTAERETEHAQALVAYQAALAAWQEMMAGYEGDRAAHVSAVAAAQAHFDSVTMPAYRAELSAFEARLEAARLTVDRIAFAGQVPVNVLGAAPGDYIVPEADGESIKGVPVADPSFEQYRRAVGKVIAIEADGRARIIVKVA